MLGKDRRILPQTGKGERIGPLTLGLVVGLLVLASSMACTLEIGTGRAVDAQAKSEVEPEGIASPSSTHTPTAAPAALIEEAPAVSPEETAVPALSPTPSPTATATKPPTATPTPIIPARVPPDRIRAAAIDMDVPVTPVGWSEVERDGGVETVWAVPDDVAGWHQNSAMPGNGGNVVLSGHHNMGSEVFRHVVDLAPGDELVVHADGRDYYYVVSDRFVVPDRDVPMEQRLQNAQWIAPTAVERLTLVTCWPYEDNSHRVIVLADLR
jgi:LPXTG-site transpeptidase (sortase) family protein